MCGSVVVEHQSSLRERIRDERHAGNDVRRRERDRFGLSEEVCWIAIQRQSAQPDGWVELKGHDLGRDEQVDALVHISAVVREQMDGEIPLREIARLNIVVKVHALEIVVFACDLRGFVIHKCSVAKLGQPIPLESYDCP